MVLRERMLRLQLAALKVDRVYDDRLSDAISDELWTEKSAELQEQRGECELRWSVMMEPARRTRRRDFRR